MSKILVYLAGPYSLGDVGINVHCQLRLMNELLDDGLVIPVAPLLSHFVHLSFPRSYESWISHAMDLLSRCDACLYSDAVHRPLDYDQRKSWGAEREIAFCKEHGIDLFALKNSLYDCIPLIQQKRKCV